MTQNTTIQWQTGMPKHTGRYLVTTKHYEVEVDMWLPTPDEYGDHWERHYDEDVIAWCALENVEPFKFNGIVQEDNLTTQEKIESVMRMLYTPIFKRRIGSEEIIKLIGEICQEMGIKCGI